MIKKYVVVDTVLQYKRRYVISLDELQKFNTDYPVEPEWALDCVTCDEINHFSESRLDETIFDYRLTTEQDVLEMFDKEHPTMLDLETEAKLDYINKVYKKTTN